MRPLGREDPRPSQVALLSAEAFFDETLFHELSHSLGPAFVEGHGRRSRSGSRSESSYSAIEEAKADVMGAYNILYMIKRGELPKDLHDELLVSYFAGLFRSMRFGVAEAHGQGAALQINRFLEEGARDGRSGDQPLHRRPAQARGLDRQAGPRHLRAAVERRQGRHRRAPGQVRDDDRRHAGAMAGLDGIPVDVKPMYPLAGETAPAN